jgi:Cd2+/Zn2+-exporting ATPase
MRDEAPIGLIAFADKPRSEAKGVIARLKSMGIPHLTMLTGDNSQTARAIAMSIGLENWSAELLPQEKVSQINELVKQWKNVAMVGDGINDAPALAASSIGIAMGGAGTDMALETADVVLMGDDLSKLPYLVELGRRTISVMKQNITLSVLVKTAFVLMAIPGWLTLWLAVIGDTGVSLLVMLNGMRLLYKRA